ncbi:glucose-6-phosphate dehydrogenase [Streptomyces sp. NPDC093675]|uniref:glucose-6-phosphate dehydrogenase n=1 Tax=Streptomyces sp. NPDC093675 TaxID=3366049 RepID=UPI00380CB458
MDTRADAVVVFGVTGDLAYKKLFPALYQLERRGQLDGPVVGVARSPWEDRQLVDAVRKSLGDACTDVDAAAFDRLAARLAMVTGGYAERALYERLAQQLEGSENPLFYLAVPPAVFDSAASGLKAAGLAGRGRVVVEKPFGHDRYSARSLDGRLQAAFAQERIYRIDHYLGKEPVEGLLALRFANALFEPLWNRDHIARVEITMAETFGTQGRAGFYDAAGAIRDVLQNHMLQVAALLTMEPPATAGDIEEETVRALRQMRPLSAQTTVRGQYAGYRTEPGVDPNSATETFAASVLSIASPRWKGVPFYLRVGKSLPADATEVVVELRQPPQASLFAENAAQPAPNIVRLRLGHDDGVTLSLQGKAPGPHVTSRPLEMSAHAATAQGERQEAYERLLADAISGRRHRFVSAAAIDEEWRIVQPLLDIPDQPALYEPGTWGPARADDLAGGWHPLHAQRRLAP